MTTLRGYLSRRANGLYLLTYYEPVIELIGATQQKDVYAVPGDPLAFNNICEWAAERLWGVKDLPSLESVAVEFMGRMLQEM